LLLTHWVRASRHRHGRLDWQRSAGGLRLRIAGSVNGQHGGVPDWRNRSEQHRVLQRRTLPVRLEVHLSGHAGGGDGRNFTASGYRPPQQNPDGEIVSIKIGRTLIHPPYGLDLSSNTENRVSVGRKIIHRLSRHLADFRSRLSGGAWLSPSCCDRFLRLGCGRFSRFGRGKFSRFGHAFNRSRQFRLRRFRSAMVTMA
jgi:hypothetical protein